MLILALDTSTRSGSIAILRDDQVLGVKEIGGEEPYSASIPRDVEDLLARLGSSLRQIDLFAVSAGPGSFTGLRVGLTAVKGWSEVFRKPIVAVSALEAIAGQVKGCLADSSAVVVAAVLDAHRGQVFGGLYRYSEGILHSLQTESGEVVASVEEFIALAEERSGGAVPVFISPTPELVRNAVGSSVLKAAQVEAASPVLAPMIGRLGYVKAQGGELLDPLRLDANYVRRPDAEVKWKGD